MQNVSCPSCGAPVEFKSHASVMAVCEYCRATVLKDAASVATMGKMSEVLEDYSRIQVGTDGVLAGRHFSVVGRIQLRYSAGMWNEWFLMFDDGATGWLGDSSGQYVITTARELGASWPSFEMLTPGRDYDIGIGTYTAAEKRVARCIGGQGELPFRVDDGWEAHVADLRSGALFATLDYSDGDKPTLYTGQAVTLEELQCQLLREEDQIKASAGRYRGQLQALECPACGTQMQYLPGVTSTVVCQACHSQLDAASPAVAVLAKGEQLDRVRFTLPLGANAMISGYQHRIIGAMVRADDEGTRWTEYLLYSPNGSFLWLVETDEGWSRASVMRAWPKPGGTDEEVVKADKVKFTRLYSYSAQVVYAVGAFNWRVAVGDVVSVVEYEQGHTRLAAERTPEELTWSRSTPVAFDQVRTWFGLKAPARSEKKSDARTATMMRTAIWWLLGLNLIPLLVNFTGTIHWVMLAIFALIFPSKWFDSGD
jgi:uncharacterized protein (DUF983 family)